MARVDTVWNRRPAYRLEDEVLHPADRRFADMSCDVFRRSLFSILDRDAFWVNPNDAVRRNSKIVQHQAAMGVGLSTPDTIYTNEPQEIRGFLRRQGGRIVYKPLTVRAWWSGGDTYAAPYTSVITAGDLVADALLRAVPGIYQAIVPKSYELRLTVMGRHVVAAKLLSQQTETGKLDWRKARHELVLEPLSHDELPPGLAAQCTALLDALGLVFGCFDFIVTPAGEHVFLEVNQMGQFLFVEEHTGQPLLDMFCELLRQGRPDFRWSASSSTVRFADVVESTRAWAKRARENHAPPPRDVFVEALP